MTAEQPRRWRISGHWQHLSDGRKIRIAPHIITIHPDGRRETVVLPDDEQEPR